MKTCETCKWFGKYSPTATEFLVLQSKAVGRCHLIPQAPPKEKNDWCSHWVTKEDGAGDMERRIRRAKLAAELDKIGEMSTWEMERQLKEVVERLNQQISRQKANESKICLNCLHWISFTEQCSHEKHNYGIDKGRTSPDFWCGYWEDWEGRSSTPSPHPKKDIPEGKHHSVTNDGTIVEYERDGCIIHWETKGKANKIGQELWL